MCHGTVELLGALLADGSLLVAGQRVTGFTNAEEAAVGLTDAMPFLLQDALAKRNAASKLIGAAMGKKDMAEADRLKAEVVPVELVGWDGDALEGEAFAFLAVRALRGLALTLPTTTGVVRPTPGGVLYKAKKA